MTSDSNYAKIQHEFQFSMKNVAAGQCILTTVKFVAAVQTVIVVITAVLELNAFPAAARKLVSRTRCRT